MRIMNEVSFSREFTNEFGTSLEFTLHDEEIIISSSSANLMRLSWADWEKLVGDINLVRYIAQNAQSDAQSEADVPFVTLAPDDD